MIRTDIKKIGVTNAGQDILQYIVSSDNPVETVFTGTVDVYPGCTFAELYAVISAAIYQQSGVQTTLTFKG